MRRVLSSASRLRFIWKGSSLYWHLPNFDLLGHDLDVAGGHVGVLAGALADYALDADGALAGDALKGVHHLLGLGHDLGRAVEIAHDDEGQRAGYLAHVLHPAAYLYALAGVGDAQLAAGVCS